MKFLIKMVYSCCNRGILLMCLCNDNVFLRFLSVKWQEVFVSINCNIVFFFVNLQCLREYFVAFLLSGIGGYAIMLS